MDKMQELMRKYRAKAEATYIGLMGVDVWNLFTAEQKDEYLRMAVIAMDKPLKAVTAEDLQALEKNEWIEYPV